MPIDFYYHTTGSPPCRLVLMVAKALGVELNFKIISVEAKEHLTPEYLKMNPQHSLPTIVDDGFALWESRAICRYLLAKYGENSTLYPKDLKSRALVDQRVDFDIGTLYHRFADYYWPQITSGAPDDQAKLEKVKDALKLLNTFLEGQKFAVGSELTFADLALVASVSTIDAVGISLDSYPNITKWYALVRSAVPNYDETNGQGVEVLRSYLSTGGPPSNP